MPSRDHVKVLFGSAVALMHVAIDLEHDTATPDEIDEQITLVSDEIAMVKRQRKEARNGRLMRRKR